MTGDERQWIAAVKIIAERDGITDDQASANLANLLAGVPVLPVDVVPLGSSPVSIVNASQVVTSGSGAVNILGRWGTVSVPSVRFAGKHRDGTWQKGGSDRWCYIDGLRDGFSPSGRPVADGGGRVVVHDCEITDTGDDAIHARRATVEVRNAVVADLWAGNAGIGSNSEQPHTDAFQVFDGTSLLVDGFTIDGISYQGLIASPDIDNRPGRAVSVTLRDGAIRRIGTRRLGAAWERTQRAKASKAGKPFAHQGGTSIRAYGSPLTPGKPTCHLFLEQVVIESTANPVWIGPGCSWGMRDVVIYGGVRLDPGAARPHTWERVTVVDPRPDLFTAP